MNILIADKFPAVYMDQMKELGHSVTYKPELGENDIPNNIQDIDILVVRSTKVNAQAIEKANQLKVIIRAGAGVNTIDIAKATEKGVAVTNCPGKNSIAVAELAMGLILALDRRIPDNVADFHSGKWNKNEFSKADGLFGKRLFLIGVGNIGKEVAKRAVAFGMKVYGYDIVELNNPDITQVKDIKETIPQVDIISIHLPQTPQTKGMFNKEIFDLMKPGTIFINTSRPGIIDEAALIEAVKTKNLKVGLDVFNDEPEGKDGEVKSPFQGIKNVYVTHHIGASTEQAQLAVAEETVRIIKTFAESGEVLNKVN